MAICTDRISKQNDCALCLESKQGSQPAIKASETICFRFTFPYLRVHTSGIDVRMFVCRRSSGQTSQLITAFTAILGFVITYEFLILMCSVPEARVKYCFKMLFGPEFCHHENYPNCTFSFLYRNSFSSLQTFSFVEVLKVIKSVQLCKQFLWLGNRSNKFFSWINRAQFGRQKFEIKLAWAL